MVGVDVDADSVRKARLLADCLSIEVEFQELDVERSPIKERFDYVLALNLLHHLHDPLAALERLIAITSERLVLEVATLGRHDCRKLGLSRLMAMLLVRKPLIYVAPAGTRGKRELQKFYLTQGAIRNLLLHHSKAIARVDFRASEHKGRFVAIAEKRRIDHLLVVSGPTSSGKKTLARKLCAGELPQLGARLGTPDGHVWGASVNANHLTELAETSHERLMFHYDFMRPFLRSARIYEHDEALDLIDCARHVSFVTIWTPLNQLEAQLMNAEINPRVDVGRNKRTARHRRILAEYREPGRVLSHYRAWFEYTRIKSSDHVVVTLHPDLKIWDIEEWMAEVGRTLG